MLPNTNVYVKIYDGQIKWMYFWIEDDDLLQKYNIISEKISTDTKINLKTKIKSHGDEVL